MELNFNDLSCKELYLIFLDVLKNHNVISLFQGKNWFSDYGNAIIIFNNDTGDSVKFFTESSYINNVQSHLFDDEEDYNYESSYSDINEIIRLAIGDFYAKELIQSYRKLFISHSGNILTDI